MKLQPTFIRIIGAILVSCEAVAAVRTRIPTKTKLQVGGDWGNGPAPAPTECPTAKYTASEKKELLKRSNSPNTCGWLGDVPFSCSGTSTCTTSFGSYIGCCGSGPCYINTVCLPLVSSAYTRVYNSARFCDAGQDTVCITGIFAAPGTTYTAFGCDTQYAFLAGSVYRQGEEPGATSVTTTSSSSTTTSSSSQISTTLPPTPSPAPHKESNAGAIAGGVVGGIAVLAIIIGGIIYFRMTNKNNASSSQNVAHQSNMTGPAGPQQNAGGYYLPQAGPAPGTVHTQPGYSATSHTSYMNPASPTGGTPLIKDYHGSPISPATSGMTSPNSTTSPFGYSGMGPVQQQTSYPGM